VLFLCTSTSHNSVFAQHRQVRGDFFYNKERSPNFLKFLSLSVRLSYIHIQPVRCANTIRGKIIPYFADFFVRVASLSNGGPFGESLGTVHYKWDVLVKKSPII
jgi:hypothetical protein